jgi:hypothetical protein
MGDIMKTLFAVLLFAAPLFAQDQAAAARAAAGCGTNEVKFTVRVDKTQHPMAQPEASKAIVYVFGNEDFDVGGVVVGGREGLTTRWGLDGAWVGASYRNSYLFFSVTPGDHRLCAGRQASYKPSAAISFTAEVGKAYYFRTETRHLGPGAVKLEPIDPAAAQLLIADSPFSAFQPKKPQDSSTD